MLQKTVLPPNPNARACLAKEVILITGAGSGIGRSLALEAAAFGATVILLGRTTAKLEAVYDEIVRFNYPEPAIYPLDLIGASPKDYADLKCAIETSYGKLNGVVHNAGYLGSLTPLELFDEKEWYKVQQTNLNAPFMLNKALLPLLKAQTNASIIFTTIDDKLLQKAYFGAYAITYNAINAMAMMLAQELEYSAVRVNLVDPGKVLTPLRAKIYPAANVYELDLSAHLTAVYIYLLSKASSGVFGSKLRSYQAQSLHERNLQLQIKVITY